MTKETEKKVSDALVLLADANVAMIRAIEQAVGECGGELCYYEEQDGYSPEARTIKYDEDGELALFDDCDNELCAIEDLTADVLYDICNSLF